MHVHFGNLDISFKNEISLKTPNFNNINLLHELLKIDYQPTEFVHCLDKEFRTS